MFFFLSFFLSSYLSPLCLFICFLSIFLSTLYLFVYACSFLFLSFFVYLPPCLSFPVIFLHYNLDSSVYDSLLMWMRRCIIRSRLTHGVWQHVFLYHLTRLIFSRLSWFVWWQVLASVKNQIEQVAARQKDFPELLLAAQQCLLARESSLPVQGSSLYLSVQVPEGSRTSDCYPSTSFCSLYQFH